MIFTDGFAPRPEDLLDGVHKDPRIGGVLFSRTLAKPVVFTMPVPKKMIDKWIPRSNPIAMVEMLAPVIANETFAHFLQGKKTIYLIDSECVLGALVKGYSAREDMCELTGVFWEQITDLDALAYLDRVSTDGNVSDDPSRDDLTIAKELGWVITGPVLPEGI